MAPHLVHVDALVDEIAAGTPPVRLLDVRWRLNEPEGRPAYLDSHLPGAVYVDLEHDLARVGEPERGRYPLPDADDFAAAVRRWGIRAGDAVVVYDDNDGVAAARAWWLLRAHGIAARILDGGFRAWLRAGQSLARGDQISRAGDVPLGEGALPVASIDEAAIAPREGVLVDVRAPQHYRGLAGGADPGAGHIPGAINVPTVLHIAPDGRLHDGERIAATLAAAGVVPGIPVVLYCNNAVASAHSALAFALAGIDTRIYVGGWSQWSRTPGRAIATGGTPADVITTV